VDAGSSLSWVGVETELEVPKRLSEVELGGSEGVLGREECVDLP
jgi:hypothetical protein